MFPLEYPSSGNLRLHFYGSLGAIPPPPSFLIVTATLCLP